MTQSTRDTFSNELPATGWPARFHRRMTELEGHAVRILETVSRLDERTKWGPVARGALTVIGSAVGAGAASAFYMERFLEAVGRKLWILFYCTP